MAKVGRKSKYKEENPEIVRQYIKECQDSYEKLVKSENEKGYKTYENKLKVSLPTRGMVAVRLGIAESTLTDWEKQFEEFGLSLRELDREQEKRLLNNGLSNDYNPTIAKLILSSNHGYAEKTENKMKQEINFADEEALNTLSSFVNRDK